jgi:hypothetical protein
MEAWEGGMPGGYLPQTHLADLQSAPAEVATRIGTLKAVPHMAGNWLMAGFAGKGGIAVRVRCLALDS